jgi:hypothetical protein
MRDAMASLLNKMKMQPKGGESRQQTAQNSQKKSGQQGQKGQKSEGQPDSKGSPSPDQQGDQQGEGDQSQPRRARRATATPIRHPTNPRAAWAKTTATRPPEKPSS